MSTDSLTMQIENHQIGILGNAAGFCKNFTGDFSAKDLIQSESGWVMLGSMLKDMRTGNPGDRVSWDHDRVGINAVGMDCPPWQKQEMDLQATLAFAEVHGKKSVMVNIAGFKPSHYCVMADRVMRGSLEEAIIEVNAGCPNVRTKGEAHPILSRDPDSLDKTLEAVEDAVGEKAIVIVKLSPFFMEDLPEELMPFLPNPPELDSEDLPKEIAKVLESHPSVRGISTINTVPNGYLENSEGKSVITQHKDNPNGLGGLSGPAVKPIGLANVRLFRKLLKPEMKIFGIGGITSGQDMLDYIEAGADACAMTTTPYKEGMGCFGRILAEYCELAGIEV